MLFLALQPAAIFYTRGLEQRNSETLFFSGQGLKAYHEFLGHFKEQKLLLVKVKFPALDEAHYAGFEEAIQGLRERFPNVEILTFFDIYRFSLKQDDLETIRDFLARKPEIQLKFVGPDYLVFFAAFDEQRSAGEARDFISQLQAQDFFHRQKVQMAGLPYINYLLDQYSSDI